MQNPNKRYDTIKTDFCGQEFTSVRFEGTDYYPISEIAKIKELIVVRPDNAQKHIKTLLGEGSKFVKVLTSLNPKKVNCITEEQLNDLVGELAFEKGNKLAKTLLKASFQAMLRAANDITHGQEEKAAYYVELAAMRAEGIEYRRAFTDLVKMQKELGYELNYGYMTLPLRGRFKACPFRGTVAINAVLVDSLCSLL